MNNISQEHCCSLFSNILLFLVTQCQILIAERSIEVNSGILALLRKPSNCGRQASTQHCSLGLLIGTRLKYNLQGHVWETGKLHPSQPDEDIQRKHMASVHFSHNMQHTPSAVHILLYDVVTKLRASFFEN